MRNAFSILLLLAAAVALALLAGNNQGSLTIFWPPHRVDVSFNLALLLLLGGFLLIHLALRGLSALLELPSSARRWRRIQRERLMYSSLLEALSHLVAGRFIRGRTAAEKVLEHEARLAESGDAYGRGPALRAMAHLLAAESAHALQDKEARGRHLQLAREQAQMPGTQEEREAVQMRALAWAMDDRDPKMALQLLEALPAGLSRRTVALRLRLKAARQAGQMQDAIETARLLAKHRAFSAGAGDSLVQGLTMEWLQSAKDAQQLQGIWSLLDPMDRERAPVANLAAQRLLTLNGDAVTALGWLLPLWQRYVQGDAANTGVDAGQGQQLVAHIARALARAPSAEHSAWLTRAEAALQHRPADVRVQFLVGTVCLHAQLWGKAAQWLERSLPPLRGTPLEHPLRVALAQLAEQRSDEKAAASGWKAAALAPR
ncbi:MAG: hypothetical protein RLZZ126_2043 [Pseudomonadota bacterium]|jgi:HemY protein